MAGPAFSGKSSAGKNLKVMAALMNCCDDKKNVEALKAEERKLKGHDLN